MKNIVLTFLLSCCFVFAFSQGTDNTIDKGTGILYYSGVPGVDPDTTYGAEIAINKLTREIWVYNRDSTAWKKSDAYSQSYADPSGDPTPGPYLHINRTDGGLFQWTGAAWVEMSPSTDDQTLSKPTTDSIAIEGGNTVVDRSLMQEMTLGNVNIPGNNTMILGTNAGFQGVAVTEDIDNFPLTNHSWHSYNGFSIDGSGTNSAYLVTGELYLNDTNGTTSIETNAITAPDLVSTQLGNFTFNTDQLVTPSEDNYVLTYDNATGEIGLEAASASGTTETGDGVTITGDGSGGSPFTVDTTLIATTQAVIDSIAALGSGSGDVTGPGSSTDNAIVRFDGTSGNTLQNSTVTISDAGAMTLSGGNIALNGEWLSGDGDNEGFFINSDGDVGVGTGTPERRFHVLDAAPANNVVAKFESTNAADEIRVAFSNLDDTSAGAQSFGMQLFTDRDNSGWVDYEARDLTFYTNTSVGGATLRMRIENDGDVGIGLGGTDPEAKLDVSGAVRFRSGIIGLNSTGTVLLQTGTGSPESSVSASIGSTYHDTTNGIISVKKSGTGSTGWKDVLQNGTNALAENLIFDGAGTSYTYIKNVPQFYVDVDGSFSETIAFDTDGITVNTSDSGTDFVTFISGHDSNGHGNLQHVITSPSSTGSNFYNRASTTDQEFGVFLNVERNSTPTLDLNYYLGDYSGVEGFTVSEGNPNTAISTHYKHMMYNAVDSSFSLFDSTLIFSKDAVPVATSGAITELEWSGDGTNASPSAVRTAYGTATITGDSDGENSIAVTISPAMPDATYTVFLTVEQETGTFTAAELQAYIRTGKSASGFTIEVADAIDDTEEIFIHWEARDN